MRRKRAVVDQERYQVLKTMLEERRAEIKQKLRSLRETMPADAIEVKDAEEHSVDDFVQEVDFALMQMKSETLAKIDEAIARLEGGTYGVCVDCSIHIGEARLKALPFAALCRACQEQEESEKATSRGTRTFEGLDKDFTAPAN